MAMAFFAVQVRVRLLQTTVSVVKVATKMVVPEILIKYLGIWMS